ncbi:heme-binding protein [Roseateles flavus]|uniref:Heme-binding protein n=1 Tax=Roseateles flavus TaxID=3149041 RepID=A0ABV0GF88_9BURK
MKTRVRFLCALSLSLALAADAQAQALPYGNSVNKEPAHQALKAALAEARKQGFNRAVAVVDTSGALVLFERLTDASHLDRQSLRAVGSPHSSATQPAPGSPRGLHSNAPIPPLRRRSTWESLPPRY